MTNIDSTSSDRTVNNAVRHQYRVLSEDEKAQMQAVKDKAGEFVALIHSLRTPSGEPDENGFAVGHIDVDLIRAEERIIEASMWAVRHITA